MKQANKTTEGLNLTPTPSYFHETNVTYHQLKIKNKPFELSFIGDAHYSNEECHVDFFESGINRIRKTHKSGVIYMGDLGDFNDQDSPGYAIHQGTAHNEPTKDYLITTLKPTRHKSWILHDGNHDGTRSRRKVGTSQTRDIAQVLNIPYCRISAYHIIDFNDHRLIIYTNHGKKRGTPKLVGTRRKTFEEQLIYKLSDIIAIGHVHRLMYEDIKPNENITQNVVIDYNKMQMKTVDATFPKRLITGHFLQYLDGYGQEEGYPPSPPGYPILKLYKNGFYDVELIYEDQWRAENG